RTKKAEKSRGSAEGRLLDNGIFYARMEGYLNKKETDRFLSRSMQLIRPLIKTHRPVRLLIDMSKLEGETNGSRLSILRLPHSLFEKIAIVGATGQVRRVAYYIGLITGTTKSTRFFEDSEHAQKWLLKPAREKKTNSFGIVSGVALMVSSISVAALFGWQFDIDLLKSFLPGQSPMNPVTALLLIIISFNMLLALPSRQALHIKYLSLSIAGIVGLYGLSIIIRSHFGIDVRTDLWLFSGKNPAPGSVATGVAFTLVSVMSFMVLLRPQRHWQKVVFHSLSILLFILAISVCVGFLFGFPTLYNINGMAPAVFNSTIAFLLLNYGLQYLNEPLPVFEKFLRTFTTYWPAIAVFIVIMGFGGLAWQQAKESMEGNTNTAVTNKFDATHTAIVNRMASYIDALYGFKGFMESQEEVTAAEFHSYFNNTQLIEKYPGLRGVSIIRMVTASQKQTFIRDIRRQAAPIYPEYTNYQIYPESKNPVLYPVTYFEPQKVSTSHGYDLGTDASRLSTLLAARDKGLPVSSQVVNLATRADAVPIRGFFISMPLYELGQDGGEPVTVEGRRAQFAGGVFAVFENKKLFDDIFKSVSGDGVRFVVRNNETKENIYDYHTDQAALSSARVSQDSLTLAGKKWDLLMYTSPSFGQSTSARLVPTLVLASTTVFAALGGALVMSLARRRERAVTLATKMTEEFRIERNRAVSLQQKDDAILSSIGDAVFAVDRNERITLFNPAAEQLTGFSAAEAIGAAYDDILSFTSSDKGSECNLFIKTALKGKVASIQEDTILTRKDGSKVAVSDSAAPIRSDTGEILGAIIVFRDVSKERALDQAKTEFVSIASHQLRTPLSAINWYTEMLLDGDAGPIKKEQREYLEEIHHGNRRMVELVDALLDVSRLNLGKLGNKPEPVDVATLAEDIRKELGPQIMTKQQTVTAKVAPQLPRIVTDPQLLRMVVQNLLSNAVKYTPDK
ncbi:MAG: multi-sensor signal transduction histidine kinase, partial [Candidatus Saccharibacteria bacterium]|nr:multi-sensor signal transduction histidine kinase [Candidatus Saccharibacteria bacterium]